MSKNGKNGHLCIKITKALSLVSNQTMELCLYMDGLKTKKEKKKDRRKRER